MPEVADLWVVLRAETRPFTRAMGDAAAKGESVTAKMGGIGGAMTKLGKATTLVGVGVAAVSVKMATEFQSATTRLVTSAGETNDKLDMVRKGLLSMAGQVGVSANDLAKSMYYVEAAGYHAGDGLTVLKAAAQGAAAEGADTTTVAQALTDVLKDYHMKASAAGDVTSKMITAVAHGKVNLQDFSSAFASIVPAASAAGISFNDVGAALANMTNHGFTAQRASQNLAQALRSLLNPTTPMKKAFAEFGVSADTLRAKLHGPNGLTDAMQYLSQAAGKAGKEGTPEFAAALKRLMGTAPGANAALSTVGANMKDTNATIKAMAGSTVDANGKVKGFAEVQQTLGQKVKQLKAGLSTLLIELGNKLIPILSKAIDFFTKHKTVTEALAIAIGVILAGSVIKFVAGALTPYVKAMGGAVKVGQSVYGGLARLGQGFRDARVAQSAFSGAMGTLGGKLRTAWDAISSGASTATSAVASFGRSVATATASAASSAWSGMVTGVKAVGGAMKTASLAALEFSRNMITSAVSGLRAAAAWTAEKIALVASAIAEKAAAAAQWLLNVAMDANPIMIVVLALAALVGGLILAYNKFGWFRDFVQGAMKAVGAAVSWVVNFAKAHWPLLLAILTGPVGLATLFIVKHWKQISDGFVSAYHATVNIGRQLIAWVAALPGRILSFLASLGSRLSTWAINAWNRARDGAVQVGGNLLSWAAGLPGRIVRAVGNLGSLLWNAGMDIVRGLWNGIVSMGSWLAGQIIGFVKSFVPGPVLKFLGISSPSKMFHEIGTHVVAGLAQGITTTSDKAAAASQHLAVAVAGGARGLTLGGGGLAVASGGAGHGAPAGAPLVVNLNIAGSVLTERDLRDVVQREFLQLGARNSTTWQQYAR